MLVSNGHSPEVSHSGWGHWYTLRELEDATDGFADENVVGQGGYGIVYRGVVGDGTQISVKNSLNNRYFFCTFVFRLNLVIFIQTGYLIICLFGFVNRIVRAFEIAYLQIEYLLLKYILGNKQLGTAC